MKRTVATFLLISTFTIVPSMPASAAADTSEFTDGLVLLDDEAVFTEVFAEASAFKPCPSGTYKVRRHTRTKKKLLNAAITSGIGAAIGAGVGGGRGALLGAGAGAGGYLTYRYIRDKRGRCVRRYS